MARGPKVATLALVLAGSLAAVWGCREARHGAHLAGEVERRWPGSRMAVEERTVDGARTVEVTVRVPALSDDAVELRSEAEGLAREIRDHYGLRLGRDSVAVELRSGGDGGVVRASRRARFRWAVVELGAS